MDLSPVTYMNPRDLAARLGGSVDHFDIECPVWDCEETYGCTVPEHWEAQFEELMQYKLDECTTSFISSILNEGARNPVCVQVRLEAGGEVRWVHGNGHHRTAVYLNHNMDRLPVVFAFDGDYMHSDVTGDHEAKSYDNYEDEARCNCGECSED